MAVSELDRRLVSGHVVGIASERGIAQSRAFIRAVLDALFQLTETEISDAITDGGDDSGIDAVYVEEKEPFTIHLLSCKYTENSQKSGTKNFPANELGKISNFLRLLIDGNNDLHERVNVELAEKIRRIAQILDDSNRPIFMVHLCSNGIGPMPKERAAFIDQFKLYGVVRLSDIGLSELASLISRRKVPDAKLALRATDTILSEKSHAGTLQSIVCSVTADQIVELIRHPTDRDQVNWDIFHENLRRYLGQGNSVNDVIFKTAISDTSYKFWYLNNGIAIVCTRYEYVPGRANPKISLIDPQIVNGCQTSNVLFEVSKEHPQKLSQIEVLVRIYATADEVIGRQIALATNTQSRIVSRDLKANDPIQFKIESALAQHGMQYVRKRARGLAKPSDNNVEPLRVGQVVIAGIMGEPHRANSDSDSILDARYEQIFNDKIDIDEVATLLKMLTSIERARDAIKSGANNVRLPERRSLAYSSFHLLFAVKELSRAEQSPYSADQFESLFGRALAAICEVMKESKTLSNYELFRRSSTKDRLLAKLGTAQLSFQLAAS